MGLFRKLHWEIKVQAVDSQFVRICMLLSHCSLDEPWYPAALLQQQCTAQFTEVRKIKKALPVTQSTPTTQGLLAGCTEPHKNWDPPNPRTSTLSQYWAGGSTGQGSRSQRRDTRHLLQGLCGGELKFSEAGLQPAFGWVSHWFVLLRVSEKLIQRSYPIRSFCP